MADEDTFMKFEAMMGEMEFDGAKMMVKNLAECLVLFHNTLRAGSICEATCDDLTSSYFESVLDRTFGAPVELDHED